MFAVDVVENKVQEQRRARTDRRLVVIDADGIRLFRIEEDGIDIYLIASVLLLY